MLASSIFSVMSLATGIVNLVNVSAKNHVFVATTSLTSSLGMHVALLTQSYQNSTS